MCRVIVATTPFKLSVGTKTAAEWPPSLNRGHTLHVLSNSVSSIAIHTHNTVCLGTHSLYLHSTHSVSLYIHTVAVSKWVCSRYFLLAETNYDLYCFSDVFSRLSVWYFNRQISNLLTLWLQKKFVLLP